ncbi:MAG: hypothetical protein ACREAE_08605 [Nitrosopumilaceae archaeon]
MSSFTKKDLIQIDATVIIGSLILLSISNIVNIGPDGSNFLVPLNLFKSIYLVTMQVVLFSTSAVIEVMTILRPWFFAWIHKKPSLDNQIPSNSPDLASPAGLFFMGIGFAWLAGTFVYSALVAYWTP